jgi:hypothetical protein
MHVSDSVVFNVVGVVKQKRVIKRSKSSPRFAKHTYMVQG